MQYKAFLLAASTASLSSAQSLTSLLSNTDSLSSLNAILGQFPSIANTLAGLSNVTLFAPVRSRSSRHSSITILDVDYELARC